MKIKIIVGLLISGIFLLLSSCSQDEIIENDPEIVSNQNEVIENDPEIAKCITQIKADNKKSHTESYSNSRIIVQFKTDVSHDQAITILGGYQLKFEEQRTPWDTLKWGTVLIPDHNVLKWKCILQKDKNIKSVGLDHIFKLN